MPAQPETLLTATTIKLYGRVLRDLSIDHSEYPALTARVGDNLFLHKQLRKDDAQLARIYGFSFEGHYYALPKPAVFLVHTDGEGLSGASRTTLEPSGVMARDWEFSTNSGGAPMEIKYW